MDIKKTRSCRHRKKFKLNKWVKLILQSMMSLFLIFSSNFYLQLSQNNWNWELTSNFVFEWHTEKFILGCLVLFVFWLFWLGLSGSWLFSLLFYSVFIGILGFANNQKMIYRQEPIYPDDLTMISELSLMKEMIGNGPFILCVLLIIVAIGVIGFAIYRSIFLNKKQQVARVLCLVFATAGLAYINNFNQPNNKLRQTYNKTATWITYSQKMNYYNVGFIGGFLYNLKVAPMDKPSDYSKEKINEVMSRYQGEGSPVKEEEPNIVFIMSESFSNPLRLTGIDAVKDPLETYHQLAETTYSGQMLSPNLGGGTANIEFEALTSLSMEALNPQLSTPYTMLVPKLTKLPSIVSLLNERDYTTTAIHPFNTSMYKRKDVYKVFGFNQFLSEESMTHKDKILNNPYISDAAAFQEVNDLLANEDKPQFVHLVTMQSHMPYGNKYEGADFGLTGVGATDKMDDYMQDMVYSSEALRDFIANLKTFSRRTLVVYWGDHLPGFYSAEFKDANSLVDLRLTEFLMYDSANSLAPATSTEKIIDPIYFAPDLFKRGNLAQPGFYHLLSALRKEIPAFEKGFYLDPKGNWTQEKEFSEEAASLYHDYELIQYDLVSGAQYSAATNFFGP